MGGQEKKDGNEKRDEGKETGWSKTTVVGNKTKLVQSSSEREREGVTKVLTSTPSTARMPLLERLLRLSIHKLMDSDSI